MERANWFAPPGVEARYQYSYGKQNWFEYSALEHRAVREGVGYFDMTSFGKFLLQGVDAEKVLNRVSANNIAVAPGRVVYTQWLNDRGGIEADLTITRLTETSFLIVTAGASQVRDYHWLRGSILSSEHAFLTDVTSAWAVISVMGPESRTLLQALTSADLSNEAFSFGNSCEIEMGYALVRATRISYVGELGWELYIPTEFTLGVFNVLVEAGEQFGLQPAGMHALNSLRIEKAYRHWGHDITEEDTPLDAGLEFAVDYDKIGGFRGREALLKVRELPRRRRLLQFRLSDPKPLLYHEEPIWRDGQLVGRTTSGMYGHTLGGSIALGYVVSEDAVNSAYVEAGVWEIEIAGERVPAFVSLKPMYDPHSTRMKI